jgi:hypothetical protein
MSRGYDQEVLEVYSEQKLGLDVGMGGTAKAVKAHTVIYPTSATGPYERNLDV